MKQSLKKDQESFAGRGDGMSLRGNRLYSALGIDRSHLCVLEVV